MAPSFEDALRALARRHGYEVADDAAAEAEVIDGWQADSGTSWASEIEVSVGANPVRFERLYNSIPELWDDLFKEA